MEIINLNDWFQEIWRQKSSYFIQCFKNVFQKKNGIVNQTPTDFFIHIGSQAVQRWLLRSWSLVSCMPQAAEFFPYQNKKWKN